MNQSWKEKCDRLLSSAEEKHQRALAEVMADKQAAEEKLRIVETKVELTFLLLYILFHLFCNDICFCLLVSCDILVQHSSLFLSLVLTGLFQVHNVKLACDSGELQIDSLKDEVEQMRVWKDKVRRVFSSVTMLCLIALYLSVVFVKYFNPKKY